MRFPFDRKVLVALLVPFAVLACDGGDGSGGNGGTGGGNGGSGGTGGGTTSSTETGGSGGSGGEPMECEGPGYEGEKPSVNVGVVKAVILDQEGKPASDAAVQVCGIDICLYDNASGAGVVNVLANKALEKPAFKYGDGQVFARLAVLLPEGDSDFGDLVTAKLPTSGDAFAAGASVESGGVTIDVPAGGQAVVDELIYPEPADQVFRAAEIPMSASVPIDAGLGIEAVFGVAPLETVFCPPAKVHVPNTPGFAAGADVEFLIQGFEVAQHWAPYGEWLKVSDGKVSADGSEIVTADGQGLPVLSTFGVRLKM